MISALRREMIPSRSAPRCRAAGPPGPGPGPAGSRRRPRDSASALASSSPVNSSYRRHPPRPLKAQPGAGLRRTIGDRSQLAGRHVRLQPVPRGQHSEQLIIRDALVGVALAGRGVGGQRQADAGGHHIQRHPGPERCRRAARLTRVDLRRAGLAGTPAARQPGPDPGIGLGELPDLCQFLGGQRFPVLRVLLLEVGRLTGLPGVQPRLPLLRRHRIRPRPGGTHPTRRVPRPTTTP